MMVISLINQSKIFYTEEITLRWKLETVWSNYVSSAREKEKKKKIKIQRKIVAKYIEL